MLYRIKQNPLVGFWNKQSDKTRRFLIYILIFIPVLLLETFLFNLNAVRSINYEPIDLTPYFSVSQEAIYDAPSGNYVVEGEEVTLYAEGLDMDVHNLHLDMDFSDGIVFVRTAVSDDGNSNSYGMAEQTILGGYPNSKYFTIHPYGNVHSIKLVFRMDPGTAFQIHSISCNARKPFHLRLTRMLVMYLIIAFLVSMRKESFLHQIMFDQRCKKQLLMGSLICAVTLLTTFAAWRSNVDTFNATNFPEYQELTRALADGHFYLYESADESLLALDNPYDYTAREELGDVTYLWDRAFFEGKYYCYFGITPVLLVYLPVYLLTGKMLLNATVSLIFALCLVAGSFYLIRQLMIRYFPKVPFFYWPLLSVLMAFSENFFYLYMRPDFYDIPIITANALTVWGIGLWLKGLNIGQGKAKTVCYALGSLCMALVSGGRPQMLLLSFLAIPLFWEEVFVKRELFSKKSIVNTVAFCLPYVLIGGFMMLYNYSRFGSVTDFGANYNLTTNDMTRRGFNLDRLGSGILALLFLPPVFLGNFPYIQSSVISSRYMGKMIVEFVVGGIFATNLISWVCLGSFWVKDILKKYKVWSIVVTGMLMALFLGCADATIAGILQRYTADISFAVLFPSCLAAGVLLQHAGEQKGRANHILSSFIAVAVLFTLIFDFLLLFNSSGDYTIYGAKPELYYAVNSYFIL